MPGEPPPEPFTDPYVTVSRHGTAVIWQIIPDNPAKRVKPPKAPRQEAKYLDEQQVADLLEYLQDEPIKYQVIIKLLIYSGIRRGELCGLEWKDINWIKNTISIRRSSQYLPGKGVFTKDTKTETSDRTIRLPAVVFDMIRGYRAWQNEERLKLGSCWQEHDRLFTTFDGSPIFPDSITHWFTEFIRKTDLPNVSIHSLRHTNKTHADHGGGTAADGSQASRTFLYGNDEYDLLACDPVG